MNAETPERPDLEAWKLAHPPFSKVATDAYDAAKHFIGTSLSCGEHHTTAQRDARIGVQFLDLQRRDACSRLAATVDYALYQESRVRELEARINGCCMIPQDCPNNRAPSPSTGEPPKLRQDDWRGEELVAPEAPQEPPKDVWPVPSPLFVSGTAPADSGEPETRSMTKDEADAYTKFRLKSASGEPDTDIKPLGAWTGVAYLYPPLWNLGMVRQCGDVILTVRQPAPEPGVEGEWGKVRFTRQSWREFMNCIQEMDAMYRATDELDAI